MTTQLVIAGFHRSFTSLTAQLLARAGVPLGSDLLGPNSSNIHGHLEDLAVVRLHNKILERHGSDWMHADVGAALTLTDVERTALQSYCEERNADAPLWGVKDPRICLFLDAWNDAMPSARFLIPVRSPIDVISSLERRHVRELLLERADPAQSLRLLHEPDLGLRMWVASNRRLLDFALQRRGECMIFGIADLLAPGVLRDALASEWGVELDISDAVFDAEAVHPAEHSQLVWDQKLLDDAADVWAGLDAISLGSIGDFESDRYLHAPGAAEKFGGTILIHAGPRLLETARSIGTEHIDQSREFTRIKDQLRNAIEVAEARAVQRDGAVAEKQAATEANREKQVELKQTREQHQAELTRVEEQLRDERKKQSAAVDRAERAERQRDSVKRELDSAQQHRRVLSQTVTAVREDLRAVERSSQWRLGGSLMRFVRTLIRRKGYPDPVDRGLRRLASVEGSGSANSTSELRRVANDVARLSEQLTKSRSWRFGRILTTPMRIVKRSSSQAADSRLTMRNRGLSSLPESDLQAYVDAQAADALALVDSTAFKLGARIVGFAPGRFRRGGMPAAEAIAAVSEGVPARHVEAEAQLDRFAIYQRKVEPAVVASVTGDDNAIDVAAVILDDHTGPNNSWRSLRSYLQTLNAAYVALVYPGDVIAAPMQRVAPAGAAALVFDHDRLDEAGNRNDPWFHLGFSVDLLLEVDVTGRAVVFDRERIVEFEDVEIAALHRDLLLRLKLANHPIVNVNAVGLHHALAERSASDVVQANAEFARHATSIDGVDGAVRARHDRIRVEHRLNKEVLASIVIPFKDRPDLLETAVSSILRLTSHPAFEILLVDTGSTEAETLDLLDRLCEDDRVRVVPCPGPFNYSRANNTGVAAATGEVLVMLNNDTRVLEPDWLTLLGGQAMRADVGAAGAQLHFADGSLQHVGVVVGMTGFAGHIARTEHAHEVAPVLTKQARAVSAVTAACLAVSRSKYEEIAGFSEAFEVTGNDVDFCLRLLAAGYRNVMEPDARLFHFEKQSRSSIPGVLGDQLLSLDRYEPYLSKGDPFFNDNLDLTATSMQVRVGDPPSPADFRRSIESKVERIPPSRTATFLTAFDATPAVMEANSRIVETSLKSGDVKTATWFLPLFDHVYRGGIFTIFRFADALSRLRDVRHRVVLVGGSPGDLGQVAADIRKAFPNIDAEVVHLQDVRDASDLPASDIAVCTLWTTAYALVHFNKCRSKYYFVQDYEPAFEAANEVFGLIEQTYRFGFTGLCNTPGVRDAYAAYGSPARAFVPGIDARYSALSEPADGPLRIVFYGRPTNPRNGFELGIEALRRIKELHGDAVDIVSAGAVWHPASYGLTGVVRNLGILPNIEAVADLYRQSHIGLVFMFTKHPSYQPLEYMASGAVTVTNINEANLWLLEDRANCLLVEPTLSGVVAGIDELVRDDELRNRIRVAGLARAATLDWDHELDRMVEFIAPQRRAQ